MAGGGRTSDAGGARREWADSAFAGAKGFGRFRVSYWRARLEARGEPRASSVDGGFVAVAVRDEAQERVDTTERRVEVTWPMVASSRSRGLLNRPTAPDRQAPARSL